MLTGLASILSGDNEGAVDEVTNGLKGSLALEARRAGDRPVSGMDLGTPVGAESIGDLAEDDGGPNLALGNIVGGRDLAIGEEDEELRSPRLDLALEDFPGRMSGGDGEQGVEAALCLGGISDQRRVLELCSSFADTDCPTEMITNFRGEDGVAAIDGVLDVAQDMGETDLMGQGEILLSGVAVGHPDPGR
ncbi:hypothetical protein PHAMO_490001 [Magnetospirillum molischianum DSM 120]|uniref:Uncharacterized protein n=1 Tax=Magnetospirillum molischianum DSM 120 TaxID=1150626 RepID=H8FWV0_MAGML|nr:hypothetical protein PHAMO_490001 [Magnetospirillum molischianum DSM 120]